MKPSQRYERDIEAGLVSPDEAQRRVMIRFDALLEQLRARATQKRSLWSRLRGLFAARKSKPAPTGLYLWGGVGRGKTYLMDLFFESVPFDAKRRTHFHRFMQGVHRRLAELQGQKNPLDRIADDIARDAMVLCFDEFFVLDIGDAMLLSGLLEALFERGVVLVATSNIPPERLYENGLQRDRFLPAIGLLLEHTQIVELDSPTDYRLQRLSQATLYHSPISADTDTLLKDCFMELAPDMSAVEEDQPITILEREIPTRFHAGDVVWFEFGALCDGPRSAFDYVEIARLFHALIVSSIPLLEDSQQDRVRRFVNLIDALYDRQVKLVVSAAGPVSELYRGSSLQFEFERTRSRLIEMQSHEYLRCGHRA